MFSNNQTMKSTDGFSEYSARLRELIDESDTIVIGAGAGLSAAAGLLYNGDRFSQNFPDFIEKYHYRDMYSAAFQRYDSPAEHWAYWSRHIDLNRYEFVPNEVYRTLYYLVSDKDYFVLTTNVDHCFQKSGFDKKRLFYTQGDYGLWQCSVPCHQSTYDNEDTVKQMVARQGGMKVPSELLPNCPKCGAPMSMNLRSDSTFVQDDGWSDAMNRYERFISSHRGGRVLYLELGVGYNTPSIIKYPFWQYTYQNKAARFVSVNMTEEAVPKEIMDRSHLLIGDIRSILTDH